MMIVAMVLLWGVSRLRFWLWLADRAGGGVKGMAVALAAALVEIVALRALFVLGPALMGAGVAVNVLLALATAGSILLFLRLPKGRWGI
jgi:hypothetical protein